MSILQKMFCFSFSLVYALCHYGPPGPCHSSSLGSEAHTVLDTWGSLHGLDLVTLSRQVDFV